MAKMVNLEILLKVLELKEETLEHIEDGLGVVNVYQFGSRV